MLNEALRHDRGHEFVGAVDALASIEPQGEGERVGDVSRVRGCQLVGIGHALTIA